MLVVPRVLDERGVVVVALLLRLVVLRVVLGVSLLRVLEERVAAGASLLRVLEERVSTVERVGVVL